MEAISPGLLYLPKSGVILDRAFFPDEIKGSP
jgi:hypothetical protein